MDFGRGRLIDGTGRRHDADEYQFDKQPGRHHDQPGFPFDPQHVERVFGQGEHNPTNCTKKKSEKTLVKLLQPVLVSVVDDGLKQADDDAKQKPADRVAAPPIPVAGFGR